MTSSVDFEQLIQHMGDAVVVSDVHGAIKLWNPAATRIFGFSEEDLEAFEQAQQELERKESERRTEE